MGGWEGRENDSRVNNVKFKQSEEEEMLRNAARRNWEPQKCGVRIFWITGAKDATMKPKPVKSTAHSRNPNPLHSHRDNFTPYVSPVISAHYIYTHMQIKLYLCWVHIDQETKILILQLYFYREKW